MNIFKNLFYKDKTDKELEEKYLSVLVAMGFSFADAKKTFHDVLKIVKHEAQKQGSNNWPENMGDKLLATESKIENVKTMLAKKRKEGVTDDDIRWWWNLADLEKRLMEKIAESGQYATFEEAVDKGMNPDEAAYEVRKKHPMYGDTEDERHTTGKDRLLPPELINRVANYLLRMSQTNPAGLSDRLKEATSFNAYIREEIVRGNL